MKQFLAVTASAIVLAIAGLASVTSASAAAPSATVDVSITPAASGDLGAGVPLRLFVTIDDQSGQPVPAGTATITVDRAPLTTTDRLADWFSGKSGAPASQVATQATPEVAAGLSGAVTIIVPDSALRLGATGVYAVGVSITGGGSAIGTARTAVAWNMTNAGSVPLALAVPLTVPATSTTFLSANVLATDTAPGGILTKELSDVDGTRVAIGIDPRIVASIRVLGKSAPQSARDWLVQLADLSNETFPLQWADADLTAALQAGEKTVLTVKPLDYAINPGLFANAPAPGSSPTATPTPNPSDPALPTSESLVAWNYTLPELSWPAENSVVSSDLPKLTASGISSAILASTNVKESTAGGQSDASGKSGDVAIAISDAVLSGYLRDAVQSTTRAGSTAALTRLATTLALIGLESGGAPHPVLATLGRNWGSSDTNFDRSVVGIYDRSWIGESSLADVLAAKPDSLKVVNMPEPASRLADVTTMLAAEQREVTFSSIAADPAQLTSSSRLSMLSLLSDEWLDDPATWNLAVDSYLASTDKIVASVQVSPSSTVTLLADQISLPITISNNLDQAVTVYLAVRPTTTLVSVDKDDRFEAVTIDANSQRRAQIPIQSLSNGKAEVVATLYSSAHKQIGRNVAIKVNVQAGWETLGTLIFAALVVAIFALGIIRNIRKRRKAQREPEAA